MKKQRVLLHNRLGRVTLDAIFMIEHSSSLTITEHPVENGSKITDHSRLEPKELSLEIGMSDSGTTWTKGGTGRSVAAFKALQRLQASGVPFAVTTRLGSYKNMLVASLSAPDDYTTMNALRATVFMREIEVVSSATVGVAGRSAVPQKTGSTNNGTQQAAPLSTAKQAPAVNQSILAGIRDTATGLLGGGGK